MSNIHAARTALNAALPALLAVKSLLGDKESIEEGGVTLTAGFRHMSPEGPVYWYRVDVDGYHSFLTAFGTVQRLARTK
jgi:hypothetical protein